MTTMGSSLFNLIKQIAERNGSIEYYPLELYDENGETWLTCDCWRQAETASEWLFSDCSDGEALVLLRAFMSNADHCTYEVRCHLSRLMALKGGLVSDRMDSIIASTDWRSYASPGQLLSYLAAKRDGADWIIRLLDVVPSDARDGLFTACWYCEDSRVQDKLRVKFDEWIQDPAWGDGDGEGRWLKNFLGKWISKEMFSYERLRNLVIWHFNREYHLL